MRLSENDWNGSCLIYHSAWASDGFVLFLLKTLGSSCTVNMISLTCGIVYGILISNFSDNPPGVAPRTLYINFHQDEDSCADWQNNLLSSLLVWFSLHPSRSKWLTIYKKKKITFASVGIASMCMPISPCVYVWCWNNSWLWHDIKLYVMLICATTNYKQQHQQQQTGLNIWRWLCWGNQSFL